MTKKIIGIILFRNGRWRDEREVDEATIQMWDECWPAAPFPLPNLSNSRETPVKHWRCLCHLTGITVPISLITVSLHGIRLPDKSVSGIGALGTLTGSIKGTTTVNMRAATYKLLLKCSKNARSPYALSTPVHLPPASLSKGNGIPPPPCIVTSIASPRLSAPWDAA